MQQSLAGRLPCALRAQHLAQAVALLGCLVTGTLARQRRMKVDALNSRLRQINTELRRRTSVEASHAPKLHNVPAALFEAPALPPSTRG